MEAKNIYRANAQTSDDLYITHNNIKLTTSALTLGVPISASTASTIGNLTLANGSITDSSGAISFGNETLTTSGTLSAATGSTVGNITLANGAIPAPLNYGHGTGRRRMPFPKSICTSTNNVICHGIPNNQVLNNGDIINVDITSILDGYYGDASRMFIIGEVTEEIKKLVEVTRECLKLGIEQVFPSKRLGDIGHVIQNHAEKNGFSVVRDFAGHGVGIEFHEAPQVLHYGQPGKGEMLRENMVFTIEPMINMGSYECKILGDGWTAVTADGSLSAQWEHTLLVTNSGAEILTA